MSKDNFYLLSLNNILTYDECQRFISLTESEGYTEAPVTLGNGEFKMMKDYRDNDRVIIDSFDEAKLLFDKIKSYLPATYRGWNLEGLNERFRFYRYKAGQKFEMHRDGYHRRSIDSRSYLTVLIYLDDAVVGGNTDIYNEDLSVKFSQEIIKGSLLIFDHRYLHAGLPVESGTKYVLRTDVMYKNSIGE